MIDPFSEAEEPAQGTTEPEQAAQPQAAPDIADYEGKIVNTFKYGASFSAPWTVVHSNNVDHAVSTIGNSQFREMCDLVAKAGAYTSAKDIGGSGGGKPQGGGQQSQAPVQKQAPGGETRYCKHGEMLFDTKVSKKTGKPYSAFFCTGPREDSCGIEFPGK